MENTEIRDESKAASNPILGQAGETGKINEAQQSQPKQGKSKAYSYEL